MSKAVTRREFLSAAAGAAALSAARTGQAAPTPRPNILFILADDLGYGDLSSYGRPEYKTAVLDGLARDGVKFTSAYAAASVCTPTRCAFVTGRYPQRLDVGLREPLTDGDHDRGLPPEHPTVASLLKSGGYETALVGKWHLGWKPEFGPNRHGFDEFFGTLSGSDDYFTHESPDAGADLWENLTPIARAGYMTDLLTDRAVQFIGRPRSRPFYLSLHYTAPHSPWEGPADAAVDHRAHGEGPMTNGGSPAIYSAMMRSMDAGIGRVLQALRRAKIEGRTLVIFTSDNGGERYSYNWPFSFRKGFLWEGGIRVPAIVRWPGVTAKGLITEQPAITMDWTATILDAAGVSSDPSHPADGETLLPTCRGVRAVYDRSLYWRTWQQQAARIGKWKYLADADGERLFDLSVDPGEQNDRRLAEPATFTRLRDQYAAWNAGMLPRLPPDPSRRRD